MGCIRTAWLSYFFLRDALSAAKTKLYASSPLNIYSSSSSIDISETPISKPNIIPLPFTTINDPPKNIVIILNTNLLLLPGTPLLMLWSRKEVKLKAPHNNFQESTWYLSNPHLLEKLCHNLVGITERISEHRNSIYKCDRLCVFLVHKQDNPGLTCIQDYLENQWQSGKHGGRKCLYSKYSMLQCPSRSNIYMIPIMSSVITKITNPKISDPADRRTRQLTSPLYTSTT